MTPIISRIVKDQCKRPAQRHFHDVAKIAHHLADVHCFEVSDVIMLAMEWADDLKKRKAEPPGRLAFLPAPVTALEYIDPLLSGPNAGHRGCLLLVQPPETETTALLYYLMERGSVPMGLIYLQTAARSTGVILPANNGEDPRNSSDKETRESVAEFENFQTLIIYSLLAMINTPRYFSRETHKPAQAMQQRLAAAKPLVGRFNLHPWTEIRLEVPPDPEDETATRESHLTGERAFHFCRSYLWVSRGIVCPGHWRGNPALGIKQTRYSVELNN
jgi:hypothetical protein